MCSLVLVSFIHFKNQITKMSSNQQIRRRVTYTQLLTLWEFLNEHRDIAVGYNKSAQARDHSKRMWERCASMLNSVGVGPMKSGSEWSKYWVDLKAKLKKKNRIFRDARSGTGGGPSTGQNLTEIELKFIDLLGDDYGSGLPGVQVLPVLIEELNTPGPSTESTEGPIYLDVNFEEIESEEFEVNTPVPVPTSVSASTPVSTPEPLINPVPVSTSVSASTPEPLINPVPVPTPVTDIAPSTQAASGNVRQRRRQTRPHRLTTAEARERLVAASETRAQSEANNSATIAELLIVHRELLETLKRIERK